MAHTRGLVISIKEGGRAQVVTDRKNACGGCGTTRNCHSCLSNSKMTTEALNSVGAKEGDLVDVSLNSGLILKSAAVMYLIPIAGLIIGASAGVEVSKVFAISETTASIIFGIAGLCSGFMITAFMSKWMAAKGQLTPIISRIIKLEKDRSPSYSNKDLFPKTKVCPECH